MPLPPPRVASCVASSTACDNMFGHLSLCCLRRCTQFSLSVPIPTSYFIFCSRKIMLKFKQFPFSSTCMIFALFINSWLILIALRQATMIFSSGVTIIKNLVLMFWLHTVVIHMFAFLNHFLLNLESFIVVRLIILLVIKIFSLSSLPLVSYLL